MLIEGGIFSGRGGDNADAERTKQIDTKCNKRETVLCLYGDKPKQITGDRAGETAEADKKAVDKSAHCGQYSGMRRVPSMGGSCKQRQHCRSA